jgi:hypothetical protein
METYLPIFQATFSDWYQLTLSNPVYVAALATAVWLLTAIVYSIKVASLKKKNIASEKARNELQHNLNNAQLETLKMQEDLAVNTEQMQEAQQLAQKEAQRSAGFEELLYKRNEQIAGIMQSLATGFDVGERPLPITEDIRADGLWQQHNRVIALLTNRLRSEQQAKIELQYSYQAEMAKRAEKDTLIEKLQTTLAVQDSEVSRLEQALEEQNTMLQQQQDKAEQVLSQTQEKHLSELARLTELEQQSLDLVNARQQLAQLEEKLNDKEALIVQLEKNKPADHVKVQAQPAVIKQDEKEIVIELKTADEEVPSVPSDLEQQPVSPVEEQTGGITGKIKNLFGKTKQEPIAAEPESAETKLEEAEIQPAPLAVEQPSVSAAKGQFGKLKNLFGSKQQTAETKQNEEETQPVFSDVEQLPANPVKGQLGKIKNLFGKTR